MQKSKLRFKCFSCVHLKEKAERVCIFIEGVPEPLIQLDETCEIYNKKLKELMQEGIGYDCVHYEPKT